MLRSIIKFKLKRFFLLLLAMIFLLSLAGKADAATLSFSPSAASVSVGNIVSVKVVVNTSGEAINNAEATIQFPSDLLEVVSVSKSSSIFSLWVEEPTFSNSSGTIKFNGGVANPGFNGRNGSIASITFKAKTPGAASLLFADAAVRKNDGLGTNILSDIQVAVINVSQSPLIVPEIVSDTNAPEITSATHPDKTLWYANKNPEFRWALPAGALAVRTGISKSSSIVPSIVYEPPISRKMVENLTDGTYYFALQIKTGDGWGKVGRYKINVDTTPPEAFAITFPHGKSTLEPQPVILFDTKDGGAGISHYDIRINDGGPDRKGPTANSNPYPLPSQKPGNYLVKVSAFDRAGNRTDAEEKFTIESIKAPEITCCINDIESGDLVRIRGLTYDNATVQINVWQNKELLATDQTSSNSAGVFNGLVTKRLPPGKYAITVSVTDQRGAQSNESEPAEFQVKSSFFKEITLLFLDYLGKIIIVALFLIGAIISFWYLYIKTMKKLKQFRSKEKEIEKTTAKSFNLLRKDINTHIERLKKAQSKRQLTSEEILFLEEFEETLTEAESVIEKGMQEISDS